MKKLQYLIFPAISLVAFTIWTILVKTIDVRYIDQIGFLGFYNLNTSINEMVQTQNMSLFDKLSDVLLYLSLLTIVPFAVLGIVQLVKRKSLFKVDAILYLMLVAYALALFLYFVCDIAKINFSPLSTPEKLKASYPSSHVFSFMTYLAINLYGLFHYLKLNKLLKYGSISLYAILCVVQIVFRLFSGNHYFTDIIGSLFLSCFVFFTFIFLVKVSKVEENKDEKELETIEEEKNN